MTEIDWDMVLANLDMLDEQDLAEIAIKCVHLLESRASEIVKK